MNQYDLNSNKFMNFKSSQAQQMQQNQQQQMPPVRQPLPAIKIPAIYQNATVKNKASFKESLKKWDMMNLIYPWLEHPILMSGTCFGLAWGVDKFSKSCGGEYEKSLVGKTANLGDRIQNSKFVQSKPFQSAWNWGRNMTNKVSNFFCKSDAINAIKTTPSEAEWGLVKDELLSMKQRVVHDFSTVARTLKLSEEGYAELSELGLDKNERQFLQDFFKGSSVSEEMASNAVQLKRIGLTNDAINDILSKSDATVITKTKQLEKLGVDVEFLQKLEKNPASLRDIVKVREACKRGKGIRIGAGHQKWLGKFQIFERYIGLDEVGNRLISMTEAKTKLGRMLASFMQRCHRGFTFGGGKIGVLLFVSPLLVETMMNVKKAEPNQKVGTAAQGVVSATSWVFTFPLGLSIMHHLAGVQYAGMSKEKVAEYRKLISEFNEKVDNGLLKEKLDYDKALKELKFGVDGKGGLKALRETKPQNLLTKICKKLGSFVTMDLETIRPYKGSNSISNIGRKIPNFLKNVGGVPMRLIIWGALTMSVLDAAINKGIKTCFGNYYDGMKAEEHENNKKAQKEFLKEDLRIRLLEAQKKKVYGEIMKSDSSEQQPNDELKNAAINKDSQLARETMLKNVQKMSSNQEQSEAAQGFNQNKIEEQPYDNKTITQNITEPSIQENNNIEQKTQSIPVQEAQEQIKAQTAPVQDDVVSNQNIQPKVQTEVQTRPESNIQQNPQNIASEETVKPIDTNTYIPSPVCTIKQPKQKSKRDNYTYIPSSENVLKKNEKNSDVNKYIPSQEGAKFNKTFDNSGLEGALKRADRAERRAIQVLSGNFESLS